jgi:hypothetical protein
MRLLCVSDVHDDEKLWKHIEKLASKEKIEVLINCGDFLSEKRANYVFDHSKFRTFFVHGNWDFRLKSNNHLVSILRNEIEEYSGYHFLGIDSRFFTEDDLYKKSKDIESEKLILITHEPPFGILDTTLFGTNAGLIQYREFLDAKRPILHVFGHIHESAGYVLYGKTLVINASVIDLRKVYLVDTNSLKVREIKV